MKFKKGDKVKVNGYSIPDYADQYDGECFFNSGHSGVVTGLLGPEIFVRFDGLCGKVKGCLNKGEKHSVHYKQCRRITVSKNRA